MKNYRPLLFENLDLRLAGFHISCLRLNRHAPEAEPSLTGTMIMAKFWSISAARDGRTSMARARPPVRAPSSTWHRGSCTLSSDSAPAARSASLRHCDRSRSAGRKLRRPAERHRPHTVRARLSSLFGLGVHDPEAMLLKLGAAVLDILDPALSALGCLGKNRPPMPSSRITRRVERALATADRESQNPSLRELARRLGYQHDYLNRQLQAECGLTLGQLRASGQAEHAQRLLRDHRLSISAVAERVGLPTTTTSPAGSNSRPG